MAERRNEPRYLVQEDALIWDLHRLKKGYHLAKIVDVSRNGMRLESTDSLDQGTQIAIDFRGMIICGMVQYCRLIANEFAIGIRIKDVLDPLRGGSADCSAIEETVIDAAVALA